MCISRTGNFDKLCERHKVHTIALSALVECVAKKVRLSPSEREFRGFAQKQCISNS